VGSNGGDGIVNGLMGRWLANERHDGATASADGTEAETIAPANLISHWLMNDNLATTNVLDNKGGNDGTAQQNTEDLHTTGKINGALTSNGSTDKINCGNGILTSNNQDFSVLFWAYRNGNAYEGLVSKDPDGGTNRNWFLASNTNYSIKIRVYETDGGSLESVSADDTFPVSTWTQIGLIVDYTNTKLYLVLNGVKVDITGAWDGTSKNEAIDFIIGWFYSNDYGFDGSIDDVRIYDKSLSLAEVEELYSAGKIVDISGNGNHGTPVNSPIYRAAPMRLYKPQILTG